MDLHERLVDLAPTADLDPLRPVGATAGPRAVAGGLVLVGASVASAFAVHALAPSVSPLVASVVMGALIANTVGLPAWARDGAHFAAKRLLRVGVALLGFQLAVPEMRALGLPMLVVVAVTVAATFVCTRRLGRRLGISDGLSLLVATGFSICGASAIAAMEGVSDAEEEEVAYAVSLVTLCGSLAIFALPLLRTVLGLVDPSHFGAWIGASVHDVGQVVGAASTAGPTAVKVAIVVKLTRIVLLAPLVTTMSIRRRKACAGTPVLPLFVVGFLATVALRSIGVVPTEVLSDIKIAQDVCLAAALFGLGTGVRLDKVRSVGGRPLLLGLLAWVLVAGVSGAGVLLTAG